MAVRPRPLAHSVLKTSETLTHRPCGLGLGTAPHRRRPLFGRLNRDSTNRVHNKNQIFPCRPRAPMQHVVSAPRAQLGDYDDHTGCSKGAIRLRRGAPIRPVVGVRQPDEKLRAFRNFLLLPGSQSRRVCRLKIQVHVARTTLQPFRGSNLSSIRRSHYVGLDARCCAFGAAVRVRTGIHRD